MPRILKLLYYGSISSNHGRGNYLIVFYFFLYTDNDNDPNRAPPCDPAVCVLPDCFCSEDGTGIPNDLPAKEVPQMITITFDDAINNNNIELYKEIFNGKRRNPNGCDIKATFFVSHKYTNYSAVQETHRKGHEIAVHSITYVPYTHLIPIRVRSMRSFLREIFEIKHCDDVY